MSLSQKDKSVITEAAALREVYGPHAAKKIARDFGVAIVTAKLWLAGRFPMARRDELAQRIRAELDRRDAISAEIRRRWATGGAVETDGVVARGRAVVDRAQADGMGGMKPPKVT
ncbi:MAG: hypothetical protein ACM3II_13810 [Rhodospirillaceae bacterium]